MRFRSTGDQLEPRWPYRRSTTYTAASVNAIWPKDIAVPRFAAPASSATSVAATNAPIMIARSMTADKATGRKLGTRKVGTGKGKAAQAGTATVTIKAAKRVARKLKRLKSAKVTVKVTVKQNGSASSVSRALTLKR